MERGVTAPDMSPGTYLALLRSFEERGYTTVDYDAVEVQAAQVILRHDVDMCLQTALAMGDAEARAGVRAWYFVLVRSPLYNAFARAESAAIRELGQLGHRVGLHVDASFYASRAALDQGVRWECDALEQITGRAVAMVSFHRPTVVLLNDPDTVGGRPHTYQPAFFSAIGYVSDSRGQWRHGHPLDHRCVAAGAALQLLTHPIWWWGHGDSAAAKLDALVSAQHAGYRQRLAAECAVYPTPSEQ